MMSFTKFQDIKFVFIANYQIVSFEDLNSSLAQLTSELWSYKEVQKYWIFR